MQWVHFSLNASTSPIKTETEDANASPALQHEKGIGRNKEASSDLFESDNVIETTEEANNVLCDASSAFYGSFLTEAVLQNCWDQISAIVRINPATEVSCSQLGLMKKKNTTVNIC